MEGNKITLSPLDMEAISLHDSNYINNKGAKLYDPETYLQSVEYYRLGAAMGNDQSISNLGYCYLYGRGIEPNTSLAIAYFKIAAMRSNVDAAYKLGDIYSREKWGVEDKERSLYYYSLAAELLMGDEWHNPTAIKYFDGLNRYPSLCYALGREMANGGSLNTDLKLAYQYLLRAEIGYKKAIEDGDDFYKASYEGVIKLLDDPQFDLIKMEEAFFGEKDDDSDSFPDN